LGASISGNNQVWLFYYPHNIIIITGKIVMVFYDVELAF